MQLHGEKFIRDAKRLFSVRANMAETYYARRKKFNKSTDLYDRARLFLYLNRHCYNGLCRYNKSGLFNVPFGRYKCPYFPETELRHFLTHAKKTKFLSEDYSAILGKAKETDVVYCDPPYVPLSRTANFTDYAAGGFSLANQKELAEHAELAAHRGAIVLISNHDTPYTRDIYQRARNLRSVCRDPVRSLARIWHSRTVVRR